MKSNISILGMYNYDDSIFEFLMIPDGIEKEYVINNILLECAELELIYPRPSVLKEAIKYWSLKMFPTWKRKYDALLIEYSPLENYDRYEDSSDEFKIDNEQSNTNINSVSAFNAEEFKNSDRSIIEGTSGSTQYNKHNAHLHGNIGVTTSQQMLTDEMKVADFNIVDIIVEDFKKRFTLLIY